MLSYTIVIYYKVLDKDSSQQEGCSVQLLYSSVRIILKIYNLNYYAPTYLYSKYIIMYTMHNEPLYFYANFYMSL